MRESGGFWMTSSWVGAGDDLDGPAVVAADGDGNELGFVLLNDADTQAFRAEHEGRDGDDERGT